MVAWLVCPAVSIRGRMSSFETWNALQFEDEAPEAPWAEIPCPRIAWFQCLDASWWTIHDESSARVHVHGPRMAPHLEAVRAWSVGMPPRPVAMVQACGNEPVMEPELGDFSLPASPSSQQSSEALDFPLVWHFARARPCLDLRCRPWLKSVKPKRADVWLQKQNEILGMENEMLADYLQRDAERTSGLEDTDEALSDLPSSPVDKGKKAAKGGRQGQQRRQLPTTLSLEDRFRIANQEMEALTKDIAQTKLTSDQNLDILKALMEETDIRIAEVKRDAYEFRRDIVVGAENPRTGKTVAEKVLKYMEDKLTQKDMQINKLLMKNQADKVAIKKAEAQLKSKAETGDDLQYIDFHQLQIENSQFVKRIEEANQELIELKRRAGRTVKILNNMKKKLSSLTAEAKFLEDEIKERKAMLAKTEHDIVKVVEEKEAARKEHKKLRAQSRQSPEMPQVVDYVSQKAEAYELEAQKRNWERKVELAETAAKRIRQAVKNGTQLPGR